jgi:lipopolysaccharide transport protein LptA
MNAEMAELTAKFTRAQRHSRHVDLLRRGAIGVLLASCVLLVVLGLVSWIPAEDRAVTLEPVNSDILPIEMLRLKGRGRDGAPYQLFARTATQKFGDANTIELQDVKGSIVGNDEGAIDISAGSGIYNLVRQQAELRDDVRVTFPDGPVARFSVLRGDLRAGLYTSPQEVRVEIGENMIQAGTLISMSSDGLATFGAGVRASLVTAGNQLAETVPPKAKGIMNVDSRNMRLDGNRNIAIFSEDVSVSQGDLYLNADVLSVLYKRNAQGGGAANRSEQSRASITRLEGAGKVRFSSKGQTATSDRFTYDPAVNNWILHENVVISRGKEIISGQRLIVDARSGVSQIEGAKVSRDAVPRLQPR